MNKQTAIIAGGAVALLIVGVGVGVAVGGGGDDNNKKSGNASGAVTTTTIQSAPAPGGNSSGGGSGGGGTPQPQSNSGNQLPFFSNVDGSSEFGDDQGNPVPVGRIDGHAIDPDGHDDQEVDHVDISWGDGNTTVATRGGNNAFSDQHSYDADFAGQTVSVKVTAVDDDGATVSQTVSISLPTQ